MLVLRGLEKAVLVLRGLERESQQTQLACADICFCHNGALHSSGMPMACLPVTVHKGGFWDGIIEAGSWHPQVNLLYC